MDRPRVARAGLAVVVVAIIVAAGIWFLFLDTPAIAESDLDATTPDPTVASAPSEFRMTVEVRSHSAGGSERANWSAGVVYDGDARERLAWLHSRARDDVSIVHYQRYSHNRTHNFLRYHTSDSEAFDHRVESIRDDLDPERETLRVDDTAQVYEYYREGARSEFEVVPDRLPPLGFLHRIPFEYDGETTFGGEAVEKYVPVSGWVQLRGSVDDGPEAYISDTSGVVYVSEESGTIVRANVSFTSKRTDVRAGRWLGDGGNRGRFTLTVSDEIDDRELAPEWTEEPPFDGRRPGS